MAGIQFVLVVWIFVSVRDSTIMVCWDHNKSDLESFQIMKIVEDIPPMQILSKHNGDPTFRYWNLFNI